MAIDVTSPEERAAPFGSIGRVAAMALLVAMLCWLHLTVPAARAVIPAGGVGLTLVETLVADEAEQYASSLQTSPLLAGSAEADIRRDRSHRSLLLEAEKLPVRTVAPPPLAPISPDPGADVIPLPASFLGGAAVLGLMICFRYLRR